MRDNDMQISDGCIKLNLSRDCTRRLAAVCRIFGVPYGDDFHCTIMYDKSNPTVDIPEPRAEFTAVIMGYKMLNDALVLIIQCDAIDRRFRKLTAAGMKHSYPELTPHVTLCYNPSSKVIKNMKAMFLDAQDIVLVFDEEVYKKAKSK